MYKENIEQKASQTDNTGMDCTRCCTLADSSYETTNEAQKIKNAKRWGIYLDLFSGIGGFAKGFEFAGIYFDKHYFSEIDKHAIANYKNNFKNAEYAGDIRTISTGTIKDRPNIITFGFPCQDLSVAGKGKGLSGERSGLFYEAIRLIKEFKPDVFIFENVKGLLSSNKGKDFELVLRTIADIGLYECEWQLLNTAWILPQNRERVYFVGHLTGTSKPRVFPISETTSRTFERQSETAIVRTITAGGHSGGHHSGMTLIQRTDKDGKRRPQGYRCYEVEGISPALSSQQGGIARGSHLIKRQPLKFLNRNQKNYDGDYAYTIDSSNTGGVDIDGEIRRLAEIECERLQGFPDNWTKYGNYDGEIKEISRTQRYKMLGNAVTTRIVELIALRL